MTPTTSGEIFSATTLCNVSNPPKITNLEELISTENSTNKNNSTLNINIKLGLKYITLDLSCTKLTNIRLNTTVSSNIIKLSLPNCGIGSISVLSELLTSNANLETLDLASNHITKITGTFLPYFTNLTKLNLNDNPIYDLNFLTLIHTTSKLLKINISHPSNKVTVKLGEMKGILMSSYYAYELWKATNTHKAVWLRELYPLGFRLPDNLLIYVRRDIEHAIVNN